MFRVATEWTAGVGPVRHLDWLVFVLGAFIDLGRGLGADAHLVWQSRTTLSIKSME